MIRLVQTVTAPPAPFNPGRARERLAWVRQARSLVAANLERLQAGERASFTVSLPQFDCGRRF